MKQYNAWGAAAQYQQLKNEKKTGMASRDGALCRIRI